MQLQKHGEIIMKKFQSFITLIVIVMFFSTKTIFGVTTDHAKAATKMYKQNAGTKIGSLEFAF